MNSIEIEECNDIEKLRNLAMLQCHILFMIGEACVDESKWHFTSKEAIKKIRECLREYDIDRRKI